MSKDLVVEPGKWRQFLATILIDLIALSNGMILGWVSPTLPLLKHTTTPVGTEPISKEEISWLNGISPIGALCILPFCSILTDRLGRKTAACLIAIPFATCWLLKIFASSVAYLLASRYFAGVGTAMAMLMLPLYVSEISGTSIRGQLGSILVFSVKIGIVLGYILGAVLSYQAFAIIGLLLPIIFLGTFIFMPETPVYLVRKGLIEKATRSLMWLKNNDKATVDRELQRLQSLTKETPIVKKSVGFRDLFRDRGTIRGFTISLGLLCGQQTCGIFLIFTYTSMIFELAGSSLAPNVATIIVGLMQVLGSWLSTLMMERAGRRSLILISCGGMAMCHCSISGFLLFRYLKYDVSAAAWIPVVALSIYSVLYCLGMGPAPFIVSSEVFNADISSFANSVSMFVMWIVSFLLMKYFPLLIDVLGLHGCFMLLATFCMCTFIFTFFLVPETKGRNIESILDELNGCSGKFKQNDHLEAAVEMIKMNRNSSA